MSETTKSLPGTLNLSQNSKVIFAILMFLGVIGFGISLASGDTERAWHAYLIGYFYFVSLALGGLFFAAIQHITKAGWSVNIRRFAEGLTSFLPMAFVFGIILLFGAGHLYEWLHPEAVAHDRLLQHKAPYLNQGFFWVRVVLFFVLWLIFQKSIVGRSLKQDETGDVGLTAKNLKASIGFIVVFALSYSFFSVDHLMSLEPHWFSTIFGVYCFAGLFQSTLAFIIIFVVKSMKSGQLKGWVDENHLHDLGKFLFAFTVFWAYIAFSQYMLIWYANISEETLFYIPRSKGSWAFISVALILLKFVVPFFALLPRWAKRSPGYLSAVAGWILIMQYVDLYWLVYPNLSKTETIFGLTEILTFCGFLGVFLFVVTRFLSKHQIVPVKDPYIHESMHHHVVY